MIALSTNKPLIVDNQFYIGIGEFSMETISKKPKYTVKSLTYCGVFAALLALCSWISIPTMVPFTMQTFAVFLALLLLGGERGTNVVGVYLLLGMVGVPVFAGMTGGLGVLVGSTGGYLLGFFSISSLYWLLIKKPLEKPVKDVIVLTLGLFLCYGIGTLQFVLLYTHKVEEVGFFTALTWCVFPYVIPDLCKLGLAVTVAKRIKPHLKLEELD